VYHQSNGSSTSEKLDSTLDANDDAITFSTDHFSLFKILASGSEYTITIDPLNGMGSGVYYGAALNNYGGYNTASCTIKVWSGNSFSLPTKDQVTVPQRYIRNGQKNYYLRGWYCVTNANQSGTQKYFQPGATVTNVEGNMMFYADWAVVNYTPSSHSGSLSDGTGTGVSLDTSNFVNINMFDYNDLVNTFSAHPFSDTITDSWGMNKPAEADQGLVFINSKASNCSIAQMKYSNAGDRYLGVNTSRWTSSYRLPGYQYIGTITPGVLTSNAGGLDSSLNAAGWLYKLFNPSTSSAADINSGGDVAGRTYVGTSNYLFQRDKQGYYYYDSTKNAAEYDQTAGRFYLKDGPDMISKSATNSSKSGDYSDFVPYNNWGDASGTTNNTIPTFNELGETNYWFGMRTDIHFYLPNDSRSDGKANLVTDTADSSNLLPTTFEFSGDDDVWVFVDGHLVLDLGGIHDVVGGTINFSDGTIKTYDTLVSDSGGVSEQTLPYSLSDYLSGHIVGEHTLTMFYMERGASESNCYIKFNMRPRYKLQLNKLDADTKAVLKDATFAFYDDQDCTIPSSLWKSQNEENSGADAANEFSTDSSGKLNCWGLLTLHPYYIQEKVAPPGYPAVTKKICLYLDAYGSPTVKVYDSSGNELSTNNFVTACSLDDTKTVVITAQNKKRETTSISVQKSWKDVSGNPITDLKEGKVSASLYRSTKSLGSLTGNTKGNYTVSFATNYFGTSNGSNSDMSAVSAGDLTPSSFSAASGSTVTIEVGTDDPTQLGIYSVTANGEVLTPSDHSKVTYSTEWCLIGKKWQCPPSHATYVIDKIAADTKIVVTFIGYLNYPAGSGTASLAASATISGSYTGGGGAASATEGDMIKAQASLVEKVSLTADSGWKYSWSNLPKKDEDGNLYYYYVVEDPLITGYDVTYPAEGLSDSGSVLKIENKVHSFSLNLVKKGTDGAQEVPLSGVEFSLYQANVAGGTWTASGNIYQTAVSDAGGNVKFAGLSKGNYILKETKAATGYQLPSEPWKITITDTGKVTVTDQNGKGTEGESTVSFVLLNTKVYVLPKTGGSGSLLYTMLGILLMITAGVMYGKRYIMDERRQKTG
jgi:fibro-slime domain-containing protein/LPXTG-motif cell wall-anchored protein